MRNCIIQVQRRKISLSKLKKHNSLKISLGIINVVIKTNIYARKLAISCLFFVLYLFIHIYIHSRLNIVSLTYRSRLTSLR